MPDAEQLANVEVTAVVPLPEILNSLPIKRGKQRRRYRKGHLFACQYSEGAARGLETALRVAEAAGLKSRDTVKFIRVLATVMRRMRDADDMVAPFIDRAVNAALLELAGENRI